MENSKSYAISISTCEQIFCQQPNKLLASHFIKQVMHIPITMQLALGNRCHSNMSYISHARKCFSSKPHRLYRLQILKRRQFRRRVPLTEYGQVLILE